MMEVNLLTEELLNKSTIGQDDVPTYCTDLLRRKLQPPEYAGMCHGNARFLRTARPVV